MFKNGFYNLLGAIIRLGLGIISVPWLVQLLGAEKYGLYAILLAIINLAALSEWSISMILTVFLSENITGLNQIEKTTSLSNNLRITIILVIALSLLTGLIIFLLSPIIVDNFGNISNTDRIILLNGCYLTIIIVLIRLFHQYFIGIEQAYNQYKLLNIINTSYNLLQTILILFAAWYFKTIISLIIVQLIISSIFIIIHFWVCTQLGLLRGLYQKTNLTWHNFKIITNYGIRIYFGVVGSAFFSQGDRIIVGHMLGLEVAGVYAAIKGIVVQINSLSSIPVQPIVPAISGWLSGVHCKIEKLNLQIDVENLIRKSLLMNSLISLGVGSILSLFSIELSEFMFDDVLIKPLQIIHSLQILIIIYTAYSLNAVGYYILFAVKKEGINTIITLACGGLSLFLIAVLSKYYGILGAVWGNSAYILTLCLLYFGFKSLNLPGLLLFNTLKLPLLLFLFSIGISVIFESFILRLIVAILFSLILSKSLLKYIGDYWIYKKQQVKAPSI